MSPVRNKSSHKAGPPAEPPRADGSTGADGLLTSRDLFGDLVDFVPEDDQEERPASRGPIRVQVGEPGAPSRLSSETPSERPTILPEDVAAILDGVLDPTHPSAAASPTPPAQPSRADRPKDTKRTGTPRTPEPAERPPARAAATAPPVPEPSSPFPISVEAPKPPPSKRPRFEARDPLGSGGGLDLAAVVESALGPGGKTGGARAAAAHKTATDPGVYGPYQLLEKIAAGGMAEVFRAKRTGVEGFEKVVAVKRILSHLSDNPEFVDMFINEAKMVAGLSHPNIVQIFDLGKIEKTYFIAMEYVHGRDLRTIMRRARDRGMKIPLDLSVLVVKAVCSALEFAHRKRDDQGRAMRIVHRDISPQNILISFEGEAKLTDFGIAKAATKARTTDDGALRGKLLYMSPEQAWGKTMDHRSDMFSLGLVFYEMVTDQRPFLASSETSVLEMVRQCMIPPPSQFNPRLPERLERLIMKTLERDPDDRYQDALELNRDLERVLQGRPAPSATELARLMTVLFDEDERGELVGSDQGSGEHAVRLEVEFDTQSEAHGRDEPASTVDKLLKRIRFK